jgi:hypothetical protein
MSPTIVQDHGDSLIVVRDAEYDAGVIPLRGALLVADPEREHPDDWSDAEFELLLPVGWAAGAELFVFFRSVVLGIQRFDGSPQHLCAIGWIPRPCTLLNALPVPPLSWLLTPGVRVEFAGLGPEDAVAWTRIDMSAGKPKRETLVSSSFPDACRCTALIRPGTLAAITARNRIMWLRADGHLLVELAEPVDLGRTSPAVACYSVDATRELLVLLADGALARVPVPA